MSLVSKQLVFNRPIHVCSGIQTKKPSWCKGYGVTRDSDVIPRWPSAAIFLDFMEPVIRSADPQNRCLEPNMEWIWCTVCEIFAFELYCDLETWVRGHTKSSKAALFDRAHTTLYSSSMPLSGLSNSGRISMMRSAVLTQSTRVTDRRTDGPTDRQTELAWHIRAMAYMLSPVPD